MKSPIELQVKAQLQMVNFYLMTSTINLAMVKVQDLRSTYLVKVDHKEATAQLINFEKHYYDA